MSPQAASKSQALFQTASQHLETTEAVVIQPISLQSSLKEVRKMKDFQPPEQNALDRWLEQPYFKELIQRFNEAFEQMGEAIGRFFKATLPGVGHLSENIREFFNSFATLASIMAGLFVLYLLLTFVLRWLEQRPASSKPNFQALKRQSLINTEAYRLQALDNAQKGLYGEAIRAWYMALLCYLDETGLASFSTTRSNAEYRVLLPQNTVQAAFANLAGQFEKVHYGNQPGNEQQCKQCEAWYNELAGDHG